MINPPKVISGANLRRLGKLTAIAGLHSAATRDICAAASAPSQPLGHATAGREGPVTEFSRRVPDVKRRPIASEENYDEPRPSRTARTIGPTMFAGSNPATDCKTPRKGSPVRAVK